MCSNKDKLFVEKQWMLDQMFDVVKNVLPVEAYAMKGGYIYIKGYIKWWK